MAEASRELVVLMTHGADDELSSVAFTIANGGMTLKGRSDYWGTIWVALRTKQIEYGTLYENVMGEMTLPGQTVPQPLSVMRRGTLEPVNAK